jgi:SnoaL-like domain
MNARRLMSDRHEIRALIVRYSNALDARRFEWLDELFTSDAWLDYRATGGIAARYPAVRNWLPPAVAVFPHMCHLVGNISIVLEGDQARARTLCLNPVEVPLPAGGSQTMFLGMWYRDALLRTAHGWRMSERVQEGCFQHNVPGNLRMPANPPS